MSPTSPTTTPAPEIEWFKTERPRRIAILGWARLAAQAMEGSGYNLAASELARGLAMAGHEVFSLQSGMTYRLGRGASIRLRETWASIACYDLVNSPNMSPASSNFPNMAAEIESPSQTALVMRWLDEHKIELVHVHSLEGYSLDLIEAVRASGRPLVLTLHNYWFVCPQVDLLHQETRVCADFDGGRRCVGCVDAPPVSTHKRGRALRMTFESAFGADGLELAKRAKWWAGRVVRSIGKKRSDVPPPTPDRLADPEAGRGFEVRKDDSGQVVHHLTLAPELANGRDFDRSEPDENDRFLACGTHGRSENLYGQRRARGVAALNGASLVTSPSEFLRRVHEHMGVEGARTRTVRLGLSHLDQINRAAQRSDYYEKTPWDPQTSTRPVRFGFWGTVRANKGLEVLARAIPLLESEVRQRCHFIIRAGGNEHAGEWAFRQRLSRFPEVSVAGGFDLVQRISGAGEYDVGVLPHIWFENSPIVMLEHFHAGKYVISSRLGGPPEWIREGVNGSTCTGGDPEELAECVRRIVRGDVRLPSAKSIHESTKLYSYPDHVREWDAIYAEVSGV